MDPNAKSVVVIYAIDSPFQLPSAGGPVNLLPNEMMQLVLDRVNLNGDINKLVRLRLVSTRWSSLIEDYCKQKKSLIVNGTCFLNPDLMNSEFSLTVSLKSVDFFGPMLKLFPNIEQLAIGPRYFDGTHFYPSEDMNLRDFAAKINSLASLKRLELGHSDLRVLPHLSQTLSQLEYIRVQANHRNIYTEMNHQFISHLGPGCVRVVLEEGPSLNYSKVAEWHNINPNWLVNLTHLEFCTEWFGMTGDGGQILNYLCEHSTRLQTLKLTSFDADPLEMTPTRIRALDSLTNLTVLKLWGIRMDIAELDQAASQRQLTSLSSVLDCYLYISEGRPSTGDKFTRVLSAIFPNLTHLHLEIDQLFSNSRRFLCKVEQNIQRFPNLRKHEIEFFSYD